MTRLLRAEWTKLRTVRGWMAGLVLAALLIVGFGALFAAAGHSSCSRGPVEVPCPVPPLGPDGLAVEDRFYFVHQPLDGDGTITARVASMSGQIRLPDATPGVRNVVSGLVPWAKAGVMIKESTEPGSPYAAVLLTGAHGVRMQYDYTEDLAGAGPSGAPRWLRLTRAGETITGEESPDGARWTRVGTARLPGLPARVRVGLFAASPGDIRVTPNTLGGSAASSRFAEATALMDGVSVRGAATGGAWSRDDVGAEVNPDGSVHHPGGLVRNGEEFAVTGTGDIAPNTTQSTIERSLIGSLVALIVVIVVAVLFVSTEYRRGLIHTTLLAGPRRGRVPVAKAAVVGGVTFVLGLAATAVTPALARRIGRGNGVYTLPVSTFTELRVVVGVAALLAVAAVFALALGTLFRRGSMAVVTAIVTLVVPYALAIASIVPDEAARWLLRLTPAAGFAIQQSLPEYAHVTGLYAPAAGYFPLPPWAGFAVLCAYAALALGLAAYRIERRDA
ncbi:hypothetical protein [Nonomuraea sp. NPDC050643]|uniref:hypothetical protein n=1 Tax=Nonomuraea sp. NPDC050643 TaxID=3155660 RepID=UPI0033E36019